MNEQYLADKIDELEEFLFTVQSEADEIEDEKASDDLLWCADKLDSAINGLVGYLHYKQEI